MNTLSTPSIHTANCLREHFHSFHYNPEALYDNAPETYKFFQDYLGQRDSWGRSQTGRTDNASPENRASINDAKSRLIEAASAKDPALLKELSESTDAKGLQRADEALLPGHALDVVNARLSELIQNPDVAYGLGTRKYSLESMSGGSDDNSHGFMHRVVASEEKFRKQLAEEGIDSEAGAHASKGASFGNTEDGVTISSKARDGTTFVYIVDTPKKPTNQSLVSRLAELHPGR